MAYTKLFHSILASTIWQESKDTRILWITMLAMTDQWGVVGASVPGLAKMAGLTIEETRAGLACLQSPDPDSRTAEHEGRRIEPCEGGWQVLNHGKYRAMESADRRREQVREAVARHRKLKKPGKVLRVETDPAKRVALGLEPHVNPRGKGIAPPEEDHPKSFVQWQAETGEAFTG